ncbi:class I SAM-dependent methyltransferase [Candidatus Pacearchaeota archaeon]|nr:class I SAM-dependent methyltransferase [Candidatus Pacearchaeota archaeon]
MIPSRKNFLEAYELCKNILSAVNYPEAELLYEYALLCPDEKMIIEVGSDKGFSTVLLAQTSMTVIAIDPHIVAEYSDPESGLSGAHTAVDYEDFKKNVEPYGNITHIKDFSENVTPMHPVGFMFIDANHSWPHPKNDFLQFESGLLPGSYVAWHDYISFPGVTRAIEQLIQEGKLEMVKYISTLCITRVPNG